MSDSRPADWDWVKHTHECNALVMFGVLQVLSNQNVTRRNEQLGKERFEFEQINGGHFAVGLRGDFHSRVFVRVTGDDLRRIAIGTHRNPDKAVYALALDADGACRFKLGEELLAPWQVLKAALEPLLFGRHD